MTLENLNMLLPACLQMSDFWDIFIGLVSPRVKLTVVFYE